MVTVGPRALWQARQRQSVPGTVNVAYLSSYPPRKCGIATFTDNLAHAVAKAQGEESFGVVAVNSPGNDRGGYSDKVVLEVERNNILDYQCAAEYVNCSEASMVNLQHEFGLFGGPAGNYLSSFLGSLRKPVVTTLHTVLEDPPPDYREMTTQLVQASDHLVVMSRTARNLLLDVYGVPDKLISTIPHGVPDAPFDDSNAYKALLGAQGRLVILTFGLMSPGKNIEMMLEAMPAIVREHPEVLYIVLGATHPEVKKDQGERYRLSLERKVKALGLENHVVFHNRFVESALLCHYLLATDIYVTPYSCRDQVTSGSLAYALAMGKVVVSTPYLYAREILADGRGVIVPFGPEELSVRISKLISDPAGREAIRKKAYDFGRRMIWPTVGARYAELFHRVLNDRPRVRIARQEGHPPLNGRVSMIGVKLDHLFRVSDDTGMLQHASYGIPSREHGYSSDDVGRGLIAVVRLHQRRRSADLLRLATTYLSFLHHAQTGTGHFHNFMGYDRRFLDKQGSEDTVGRVIWGLGNVARFCPEEDMRALACRMVTRSQPLLKRLESPRSKAYAICGLHALLQRFPGASHPGRLLAKLAQELEQQFEATHTKDWPWFEPYLAYGNAKMSESLLLAYECTGRTKLKSVGLASLEFLTRTQWNGEFFDVTGNSSLYLMNGEKPVFGQQPIEAGYLVEAYVAAFRATGDSKYLDLAHSAWEWFWGRNRLGVPLYNPDTGCVADGLDSHGVSTNCGAESLICFLLAFLALSEVSSQARPDGLELTEPERKHAG